MLIRPAASADAALVSSILREAEDWLVAQRTPMWQCDELLPARIAHDVRSGLFYLAERGGEAAGTIKLQLSDPEFWPDVPEGESAFVHRLAIRRRFAGQGVSTALLAFAREHAQRLDRRYLRLDCEAARHKLRAVYEAFGFRHHSDRRVGPYFVSRYELWIGVADESGAGSPRARPIGG